MFFFCTLGEKCLVFFVSTSTCSSWETTTTTFCPEINSRQKVKEELFLNRFLVNLKISSALMRWSWFCWKNWKVFVFCSPAEQFDKTDKMENYWFSSMITTVRDRNSHHSISQHYFWQLVVILRKFFVFLFRQMINCPHDRNKYC